MFKKTSHRLGLGLLTTLGAAVLMLNSALQGEPSVSLTAEVDSGDIARVIDLVREHDPRRVRPGRQERVVLRERDIDVLVNHMAYRRLGVPVRIGLTPGVAEIDGSLHVGTNPFGRWLNVHVRLRERAGMAEIESLRLGGLPLPAALGLPLARYAAGVAGLEPEFEMAGEIVKRVNFLPQNLAVSYELRRDSAERIVAALIARPEQERLKAYSDRLVALAAVAPNLGSSLAGWMGPMFELARQRSAAGGDAAAENRAAILVLTLYANGRNLGSVLPAARDWQRPRPQRLTLSGRDDSPLHLLISAALVVEGTGPLSRAVGLFKEVADSRGGSGFSFNDLAADRAGTRLGELAMQQPLRLQTALAGVVQEADFMPHAADLPEAMAEPEFKRRFGGVGEPRYVAMLAEIDRRVNALPALR